jgi:hypothetical protein
VTLDPTSPAQGRALRRIWKTLEERKRHENAREIEIQGRIDFVQAERKVMREWTRGGRAGACPSPKGFNPALAGPGRWAADHTMCAIVREAIEALMPPGALEEAAGRDANGRARLAALVDQLEGDDQ